MVYRGKTTRRTNSSIGSSPRRAEVIRRRKRGSRNARANGSPSTERRSSEDGDRTEEARLDAAAQRGLRRRPFGRRPLSLARGGGCAARGCVAQGRGSLEAAHLGGAGRARGGSGVGPHRARREARRQ